MVADAFLGPDWFPLCQYCNIMSSPHIRWSPEISPVAELIESPLGKLNPSIVDWGNRR